MKKGKIVRFICALIVASVLVGCGSVNSSGIGNLVNNQIAETEKESQTEGQNQVKDSEQDKQEGNVSQSPSSQKPENSEEQYTCKEMNVIMYAISAVNVRKLPISESEKIGELSRAQEVMVTGQCNETSWYRIDYNDGVGYVSDGYLVKEKPIEHASGNVEGTKTQREFYDLDRDGMVTEEEIEAYDAYWGEPTNKWDRAVLLAGMYKVVDFGEGTCHVMVWHGDSEMELAYELLDEYISSKGYWVDGGAGGNIDGERARVVRGYRVPQVSDVYCEVLTDSHGEFLQAGGCWPPLVTEGYTWEEAVEACTRMAKEEGKFYDYNFEYIGPENHVWSTCNSCQQIGSLKFRYDFDKIKEYIDNNMRD